MNELKEVCDVIYGGDLLLMLNFLKHKLKQAKKENNLRWSNCLEKDIKILTEGIKNGKN